MPFLDESTWQGKIFSGGWKAAAGGEASVIEPATRSKRPCPARLTHPGMALGPPRASANSGPLVRVANIGAEHEQGESR